MEEDPRLSFAKQSKPLNRSPVESGRNFGKEETYSKKTGYISLALKDIEECEKYKN